MHSKHPTHAVTSSYLWSASSDMYLASLSCTSRVSNFSSSTKLRTSRALRFLLGKRAAEWNSENQTAQHALNPRPECPLVVAAHLRQSQAASWK